MATNMPPHNLARSWTASFAMIEDPSIDVERLAKHIKGPDFPTGGTIVGRGGIRDAYRSGRGRIIVRGKAHIEELRGGKNAIIITELPYGIRKGGEGGVIERIAELVESKILTEVPMTDDSLQDHSDKSGNADLRRAEARGGSAGGVEQDLQAHVAADLLRLQRGRACRRRPANAFAVELIRHYLDFQRQVRHPPVEVRATQGGGARACPSRLPDRARQPRCGDQADPRRRRRGRRARRADDEVQAERDPGAGDPRSAPGAAHRAGAQGGRDRVRRPRGAVGELRLLLSDEARIAE